MAYIPEDAEWYLARIVVQIDVADDLHKVVHINTVLVRARSPDDAYQKATEIGTQYEQRYENSVGEHVTVTFRGLRDLNVIHDKLEHGAELAFEERLGLTEQDLRDLVRPRNQLGVFLPITASTGPNYAPRDIMEQAQEHLEREHS